MSKLIIQSERCIACGKCYLNYPQVFDCEDDGIAFVQEDATEQDQKIARSAIFDCPTRAIEEVDHTPSPSQ